MNQPSATAHQSASGRFRVSVVDAKTGKVVRKLPWQSNLILDSGLDRLATESWTAQLAYCVAGTGSTPTKDVADPGDLFSQSGTTVTRDSGTRDFISGDVGKLIRFASGEEAYITAFIGATSVTVGTSQTVASGAIDALYRVAQTGLATESKRTSTQPEFTDEDDGNPSRYTTHDAALGTVTMKVTRDFSEEVGSVNYTEIGMSSQASAGNNLFSRMLLAGAVTVGIGQLLRVKYELTVKVHGAVAATQTTVADGFTGWPYAYDIVSIVSNGTYWDVTLGETHHFLAGGKFNINGAKRPRTDITVAASTVSDFTLTAPGHAITAGQSITVEGMTPSGYNGTFTVDSVAGDDIIVLSVLNPGAGTVFGNVRQTEPGTWYDGTDYTIASIPSAAVVRITNATSIAAAGPDGTAYNNVKRKFVAVGGCVGVMPSSGYGVRDNNYIRALAGNYDNTFFWTYEPLLAGNGTEQYRCGMLVTAPTLLPGAWPLKLRGGQTTTTTGTTVSGVSDPLALGTEPWSTNEAYTNGTFYRDYVFVFGAGSGNGTAIKMIGFGNNGSLGDGENMHYCQGYVIFEEPQRKNSTHKLTLTFRRTWGRDLTTIPL